MQHIQKQSGKLFTVWYHSLMMFYTQSPLNKAVFVTVVGGQPLTHHSSPAHTYSQLGQIAGDYLGLAQTLAQCQIALYIMHDFPALTLGLSSHV